MLALLCCVSDIMAKETIKYGSFTTYKGKVDNNSTPSGKGELITSYSHEGYIHQDYLCGNFSNGVVTKAELYLNRYKKNEDKSWNNFYIFKGTVEYEIKDNGKSVTYMMKKGVLKIVSSESKKVIEEIIVSPVFPWVVTRTPSLDDCFTNAGTLYMIKWYSKDRDDLKVRGNTNLSLTLNNLTKPQGWGSVCPDLHQEKNIYISIAYEFQDSTLNIKQRLDLIEFEEAGFSFKADGEKIALFHDHTITKYNDKWIGLGEPNFIVYKDNNAWDLDIIKFKFTGEEGYIVYDEEKGLRGFVEYEDNSTYEGTFELSDYGNRSWGNVTSESLIKRMGWNEVDYYPLRKLDRKNGVLCKNGENIEVKDGKTPDDLLAEEKKAKEEAEEKARLEKEREQRALEHKQKISEKQKQINQCRAKHKKKYGAISEYLSIQGKIVNGMSLAFIQEYINDYNRLCDGVVDRDFGLQSYYPTTRDMMQFGRNVIVYKLYLDTSIVLKGISGKICWTLFVVNGKVVGVIKNNWEDLSLDYILDKMRNS